MEQKVFGQRVTADDVESMPASWGAVHLAELGNALIQRALARAGMPSATLQTTERINVPDGGIDAECRLPATVPETGGLVGPGRTIYQFKYRDARRGRKAVVSEMVRALRQEVLRIAGEYDRYVLLTNLDLTSTDSRRLVKAASSELPCTSRPVIVWHAAAIAGNLNTNPDLRHLFFGAGSLSTLQVVERELKAAYRDAGWPDLVDREAEMAAVDAFLADPTTRLLRIQGPRYAGKSRLALEALKRSAPTAIWATSPATISLDLFRDLDSVEQPPVLVVDGCGDTSGSNIVDWADQRQRLKTIVIQQGGTPTLAFRRHVVRVEGLRSEHARAILHQVADDRPFDSESRIVTASGGLPGLLLHLAISAGDSVVAFPRSARDAEQRLGEELARQSEAHLDLGARRALEVAAILPVLGIEGEVSRDLDAVSSALRCDPALVRLHLRALEDQGMVRRRGRFLEVIPPLLANHLADRVLALPDTIEALTLKLRGARFLLLLDRLSQIPGTAPRDITTQLLRTWCRDFDILLASVEKVERLAPTAPIAALEALQAALEGVDPAGLRDRVRDGSRRALVRTLEELALRATMFEAAAALILRLAEAENESFSNNATGVFVALFHWRHPQVTAPLSRRLGALRQAAYSTAAEQQMISARAAAGAFREHGHFALREPRGGSFREPGYRPGTLEEVGQYALGVLSVLQDLARGDLLAVRDAARAGLLEVSVPLLVISAGLPAVQGRLPELSERTLEAFEVIVRAAGSADLQIDAVRRLDSVADRFGPEHRQDALAREIVRRVTSLKTELTTASLRNRLWWWVGRAAEEEEEEGARFTAELRAIASDLIGHPDHFAQHLPWLTGEAARGGPALFYRLGDQDAGQHLLSMILSSPGGPTFPACFAAYFSGWAERSPAAAAQRLDQLIESRPDLVASLLPTISSIGDRTAVGPRTLRLVRASARLPSVSKLELARLLGWRAAWSDISDEDAEAILAVCDDETPEVRAALLMALRRRPAGRLTPRLRSMGWEFLRSSLHTPAGPPRDTWDAAAAKLGEEDPKQLLALLREAATVPREATAPFPRYDDLPRTWKTLQRVDRPAFVRLLVGLAASPHAPFEFHWMLRKLADPDRDHAILRECAETSPEAADTLAGAFDATSPGFWTFAKALLVMRGDDERIRARLQAQVFTGAWAGSALPMIDGQLEQAQRLLNDPNPRVASWAQEVVSALRDWRVFHEREDTEGWIWDYRIRRAELEGMVNGPDSPERRWAIGRLLKDAPDDRVRELLSPDDILEALPTIEDLDPGKRRRWEAWGRHFRSEGH